ncbi:hypothetical protein HYR54_03020 [Candidatus Acetothermia bacterium]|nr:hypothetical protein [Candidatus Acetothermia bacterium]
MAYRTLPLKHWLSISGVASLGVLCLLAATSTGLANRKTPEDLAELRAKSEAIVLQTEYTDRLFTLSNAAPVEVAEPDQSELAQELQEIDALKRLIRQAHPINLSSIDTQSVAEVKPALIEPSIESKDFSYPDLLVRQKASIHHEVLTQPQLNPTQTSMEAPKAAIETNKSKPSNDAIWVARWRLIDTVDAGLSPASYEAVLFNLLLGHYLEGHLEAGWAEVQVWLEVLVKHGLAEKDAQKLRLKLAQAYEALSR